MKYPNKYTHVEFTYTNESGKELKGDIEYPVVIGKNTAI